MTSRLARGLASCATVTALALGTAGPALAHGDGHNCNAAYKVHVTKSDGSHAFVVEDADFNVLAVKTAHRAAIT